MERVAGRTEAGGGYRLPGWLVAVIAVEVALFGLAVALSAVAAAHGDPFAGDLRLTRWVQDFPSWFEPIAKAMRMLNGTQAVLSIGAASMVGLWIGGRRWEAATLAIALVALAIMQPTLKNLVDRPRPDPTLVERRAGFGSESFPSGHMMSGFVLFTLIGVIAWGLPLARSIRVVAVATVAVSLVLNGTASVYLGVHWPTDIAGGVLWGAVIVIPAATAVVSMRRRTNPATLRSLSASPAPWGTLRLPLDGVLLSDVELLEIEINTLWSRDERGRLVRDRGLNRFPAPHLVIGVSSVGQVAAVGSQVPDGLAAELIDLVAEAVASAPEVEPPGLDSWAGRLASALGPVEVTSGPSYVAASVPVARSAATMVQSDGSKPYKEPLQAPKRARWEPEEWRMLLDGALGPWAAATVDGQVIAICFSACLTERAAEAGVWTDPDHRGRGHAAAVTAAWASQLLLTGRQVFYSTSATNLSSQRVAARLGLRQIGWMWQVGPPRQ